MHNTEAQCLTSIENPNMLVPWFLMAAHAYYHRDDPIISDALYDLVAKRLYAEWDTVHHRHKKLIRREDIASCGSAYWLQEGRLPSIVRAAVASLQANA